MEKDERKHVGFGLSMTGMILCVGLSMVIYISTYGNAQGAEKYPARPVDIVVAFAAGSATDYLSRFFAEEMSKRWGQPVNVINKPGGNGVIGTHAVMTARPDGYTVLMDIAPTSSALIGVKGLPYEVSNRTFLALTTTVPEVIILSKSCPWNSLQELAEAGRKDPASIVWGASSGGRGAADLANLQFFEAAGIDVPKTRRVDFTGNATSMNAIAGGHIKLAAAPPATVMPVVTSGKAKALAVTAPKRISLMADVPTTREAGFPTVDNTAWKGFSGPPGIPTHVKEIFVKTVEEILKDPGVIDKLGKRFDAIPIFLGPEAFRAFVYEDGSNIERLLKLLGGGK